MTTVIDNDVPPPLPDAPYVIGNGFQYKHAVRRDDAARVIEMNPGQRHLTISAECGEAAVLVAAWGAFERGNPHLTWNRCPTCAWAVALAQNTVHDQLRAIAPRPRDLAVLSGLLDEPLMAVRVCEAIIAGAEEGDYDLDHPHTAHLLGHATAHAPMLIVPEDCSDDSCDHLPADQSGGAQNPCPVAIAACAHCSARDGNWAGELAGQFAPECTVIAPCSVLTSFAGYYDITIGSGRQSGEVTR